MSEIREISETLLPALWRASWQSSLVITVLWCLCRTLERYHWFTADLRCWLWRAAYVKLLISFAVSGSVVLPVLPAPQTPSLSIAAAPQLQTTPLGAIIPATTATAVSASPPLTASPSLPWQAAVAILYLVGVSVCLTRIVRAGLRTHHLLRQASPTKGADAEAEIRTLAGQFGLGRVPHLQFSRHITVPVYAAGTVLLPAAAAYTPEERRLILAHELAHARRRDLVWEWLGTLAQALFCFHPLVLLARREEHLARESAADALALHMTQSSPASYGKMLLSLSLVISQSTPTFAGVVGAMKSGKLLRRRLIALREVDSMSLSYKQLVLILGSSLAVAGVVLVPWRITQAAQPDSSVPGTFPESNSTNPNATTTASRLLSTEKARPGKSSGGNRRVLRELEAEYRTLFGVLRGTDDQKVLSWYQNQTTPDFVLTKPTKLTGRYSWGTQSKSELISEIKTHTRQPLPAMNTFFINNVTTVLNNPEQATADCFVKVIFSEKDSKGRVIAQAVPPMVVIDLQRDVWTKVRGRWKLQSSKVFLGVKVLVRGKPAVKVGNRYQS